MTSRDGREGDGALRPPAPLWEGHSLSVPFCGSLHPQLLPASLQPCHSVLINATFGRHRVFFNSVSTNISQGMWPAYLFPNFICIPFVSQCAVCGFS